MSSLNAKAAIVPRHDPFREAAALMYSGLQKYSPPLNILSHFNHKCKCILLGFYVIDQHEVVHNCEVEGK